MGALLHDSLLCHVQTGAGVSAMEVLVAKDGYRCVRFNPYIWPDGQKMTNEVSLLK